MLDRDGSFVGTVRDTYPLDGSGEVQLLLIRAGRRFGRERYVPADGLDVSEGAVKLPVTRAAVEDCPPAEDRRWGDPADVARGYWITAGP